MPSARANNLFIKLATQLSEVSPQHSGVVCCPLCFELFDYSALKSGDITEEHIIPKATGGRWTTLSCKRCNNTHGTKTDAHLAAHMKVQTAFSGSGSIDSRVRIAGHLVRANFLPGAGTKDDPITMRLRMASPSALSDIRAAFQANAVDGMSVTLNYNYIHNRFRLALVKIAYLTLFEYFGYRYILSPPVREFWSALSAADLQTLDVLIQGLTWTMPDKVRLPQSPIGIARTRVRTISVFLVAATLDFGNFGILLPSEESATPVFQQLKIVSRTLGTTSQPRSE